MVSLKVAVLPKTKTNAYAKLFCPPCYGNQPVNNRMAVKPGCFAICNPTRPKSEPKSATF